jgi:hypothetical protein
LKKVFSYHTEKRKIQIKRQEEVDAEPNLQQQQKSVVRLNIVVLCFYPKQSFIAFLLSLAHFHPPPSYIFFLTPFLSSPPSLSFFFYFFCPLPSLPPSTPIYDRSAFKVDLQHSFAKKFNQ